MGLNVHTISSNYCCIQSRDITFNLQSTHNIYAMYFNAVLQLDLQKNSFNNTMTIQNAEVNKQLTSILMGLNLVGMCQSSIKK